LFSTTADAFQQLLPFFADNGAYVTVFASNGDVQHSTHLAGSDGSAGGAAIALNIGGEVYVAGTTTSTQFPGAPAIEPQPSAGFVSKLSPDLTALRYTTLLGAVVTGVAVFQPASHNIGLPPQIYATGDRYSSRVDQDVFIVKLEEGGLVEPNP
jgi:hypothetical protein